MRDHTSLPNSYLNDQFSVNTSTKPSKFSFNMKSKRIAREACTENTTLYIGTRSRISVYKRNVVVVRVADSVEEEFASRA